MKLESQHLRHPKGPREPSVFGGSVSLWARPRFLMEVRRSRPESGEVSPDSPVRAGLGLR